MKYTKLLLLIFSLMFTVNVTAQNSSGDTTRQDNKLYKVEKNDGTIYIGVILKQDARELLIRTEKLGELYIPKHEIKSITEVKEGDLGKDGEFIPNEIFATRYFITTNSLPLEKGESYILWNLYGPDFQFGVAKNFGVGIMTSWLGIPVIGTVKLSLPVSDDVSFGVGALLGTGSWAAPDFFMGLPYATATIGKRRSNLNFSAGYGLVAYNGSSEGRALFSIAGMTRIGKKISLVFDSFIVPAFDSSQDGGALILPGFRFQTDEKGAFQFGFGAAAANGDLVPVPLPFVSWFRKL